MIEPTKPRKSTWGIISQMVTIGLILYVAFLLSRSTWHNYQTNQQISALNDDLKKLQAENQNLNNEIVYYQTESFKELEARRRLGLKKQGENVVVLPGETEGENGDNTNTNKNKEETIEPNYIAWFHYVIK